MAIIENLSTLESSNAALSVTLHQNHFRKDGTYYARVSRNTATFNNVISEIADRVIKFNSGKVHDVILNKKPKSVDEIEW